MVDEEILMIGALFGAARYLYQLRSTTASTHRSSTDGCDLARPRPRKTSNKLTRPALRSQDQQVAPTNLCHLGTLLAVVARRLGVVVAIPCSIAYRVSSAVECNPSFSMIAIL